MSVVTLHTSRNRLGSEAQRQSPATSAAFKVRHYLASLAMRLHDRWQRRATVAALGVLSDRELHDIGIDRTTSAQAATSTGAATIPATEPHRAAHQRSQLEPRALQKGELP
jgi:uncharacterized protein YjiS (DUF1127 family)